MVRLSELCKKEVINIGTGAKLGYIDDVTLDVKTGYIEAIVVTGGESFLFFGKCEEIVIPWCDIDKIGEDTILVDCRAKPPRPPK